MQSQFLVRLKSRGTAHLAGAALIMAAFVALSAPVIASFHAEDVAKRDLLAQLATARAQAALAPAARDRLSELRLRMQTLPGTLSAKTTGLAQSQLQQTMESLATGTGATIRSAQILPVSKANGFERIEIQYDMAVPMSKLRDLSYAIETHTPYLFIDNAQISAGQSWQAAGSQAQDPQLDVRWTVRGYRWSSAR